MDYLIKHSKDRIQNNLEEKDHISINSLIGLLKFSFMLCPIL